MSFVYSVRLRERLGFTQSIVDSLSRENEAVLRLKQDNDMVVIDSDENDSITVPIRRPSYCPFAQRNQVHRTHISDSTQPTGRFHIPVASACLLSSPCAEGLLLTQRPQHMRSYPGLWVPPGGHSDPGESIEKTALRELCEELGFEPSVLDQWLLRVQGTIKPLCAWEAAYPVTETPSSHHLVLYYIVEWPTWLYPHHGSNHRDNDEMFDPPRPPLCLSSDEVHAAVWLPRSVLSVLSQDWIAFDAYWDKKLRNLPNQTDLVLNRSSNTTVEQLNIPVWYWSCNVRQWERKPVNQFICSLTTTEIRDSKRIVPVEHEGTILNPLSAGTLYAITQWLSLHNKK